MKFSWVTVTVKDYDNESKSNKEYIKNITKG